MSTHPPRDLRAQLPLPAHDLHILLAVLEGPKHGYAIIQAVEEATGRATRLGTSTVYAALKRMLGAGMIAETERPADEPSGDVRRRYYVATPFGQDVAREAARDVERLHALVRRSRLFASPKRSRP